MSAKKKSGTKKKTNKMSTMRSRGRAEDALLQLVAKGNSIICAISALSEQIPQIFRDPKGGEKELIQDFSYFKIQAAFDAQIDRNERLQDLDRRLKDEFLPVLSRFYGCFESIERYAADICQFTADLEEGKYIQQNVDVILESSNNKQLLAEGIYLVGVMLLAVDVYLPGIIRERILVSYYRYCGETSSNSSIDAVCQLLRSTGFQPGQKRVSNYPENLFSRVSVSKPLVKQLVGMLRSEDIYSMVQYYPKPEERSTALSIQAGILVVLLYFDTSILKQETATMREIVDKYFPDNWIVSIYLGITICLPEAWDSFKAAKAALTNVTGSQDVKNQATQQGGSLRSLIPRLDELLLEGAVTTNGILQSSNQLISVIRESNVCLRWCLLHILQPNPSAMQHKKSRQLNEICVKESGATINDIFDLLLKTARLEQHVRSLLEEVMDLRAKTWQDLKQDSSIRLEELASVFGGEQKLNKIQPNKKLQKWLTQRSEQIKGLELEDGDYSARQAVRITEALDEAKNFNQIASNLQVVQYLGDVEKNLVQMIQLVSAKDQSLVKVQILSDFSYGWNLIKQFSPIMQKQIKKNPVVVSQIKSIFIKLANAMEGAMLRLGECNSYDLVEVSQYYSSTLIVFIRNILQVIPDTMFNLLDRILATKINMIELPTRLEKENFRGLAQLEQRFEIASLTHQVSVLSRGILALGKTLLGVVEIDPKKLLEEGMRIELIRRVKILLEYVFTFNPKTKDRAADLKERISKAGKDLATFKESFEYIQDYIGIPTMNIWQEEMVSIFTEAVEIETTSLRRARSWNESSNIQPKTFLGRLAKEIISIIDQDTAVFMDTDDTWYNTKPPNNIIVNEKLISDLCTGVGVVGIHGISRITGLMISGKIEDTLEYLQKQMDNNDMLKQMMTFEDIFDSVGRVSVQVTKPLNSIYSNTNKNGQLTAIIQRLTGVGQLILLRSVISFSLSRSSSLQTKTLRSAVTNLQTAIVTSVSNKVTDEWCNDSSSVLISEIIRHCSWIGINSPEEDLYCQPKSPPHLISHLMCTTILYLSSRREISGSTGLLISRRSGDLDAMAFIQGVRSVLNHYPGQVMDQVLSMLQKSLNMFKLEKNVNQTENLQLILKMLSD